VIQCTSNIAVLFTYVDGLHNYIYKLLYDTDNDYIRIKVIAYGNFGIPMAHTVDGKIIKTEISGIFSYEHSEL